MTGLDRFAGMTLQELREWSEGCRATAEHNRVSAVNLDHRADAIDAEIRRRGGDA